LGFPVTLNGISLLFTFWLIPKFEFATTCCLWHPRLESDYTWAALKEYSVNLYSQGTLDWHLSPWKL